MPKLDVYEQEVLSAYEEGTLKSVATKEELAKFKAPARAATIKGSVGKPSACDMATSAAIRSK